MKNILKMLYVIMTMVILLTFSTVYAAEVQVQMNGKIIDFTDQEGNKVNAQIINSRTMVPLRKIFEELGCEIEWDNATRTVYAQKNDKQIILQIGNKTAIIKENGIESQVILDTTPVIIESRTLVPLRFIAESLGKQVGWDSSAYTAIIIDYDYFANKINEKNPGLYSVLNHKGNLYFNIARNYTDLENNSNKNVATLKGSIVQNGESSKVTLNFEGNNELIKDIASEGWNVLNYEAIYNEKNMQVKISNTAIAKLLNVPENQLESFEYTSLNLRGNAKDELSDGIKMMFNIDDKKVNASTFNKLDTEFNKILNLFVVNGTRNINYSNAKLNTFDYMDFDSVIYSNEMSRTLSFINKVIFNYDFKQDEFLYDWNKISYTINSENGKISLQILLENEYNERVNYNITCEAK